MSSAVYPSHPTAGSGPSSSRSNYYRPATIAELAAQAQENLWDPSKGLKHWLRTAEKSRRTAEALLQSKDYEGAFVEFAKAATIVLEKLPTHREYQTLLNADQRHNLGMNGQDILDSLSQLKPVLVERYENWQAGQSGSPGPSRTSTVEPPHLTREEERAQEAREAARREEAWKQEDLSRRQAEDRERQAREEAAWRQSQEARKREAATAEFGSLTERQRREEENRRYAAEEAKREEERARRRAAEDKRAKEQDGIMRRQQEAEAAARAARRDIAGLTPSPHPPSSASSSAPAPYRMPEPEHVSRRSGRSVHAPQPSRPQESYSGSGFSVMPLENPLKYDEDSATDVEGQKVPWSRQRAADQTPKAKQPGVVYPPPITTTSPPPPDMGSIKYPSLMSQHQLKQGYVPSLQSMFAATSISQAPDSSLLFDSKPQRSSNLYNHALPPQSAPVVPPPVIPPYPTHMPVPESHQAPAPHPPPSTYTQNPNSSYSSGQRGPSPNGARQAAPRDSGSAYQRTSQSSTASTSVSASAPARIVAGNSKDANLHDLRTIKLPRECLPKFLSIARVNTLQNRETCGLLLGKDKGSKYVVTTLLIPKQHSTSDTCMMDEEELVLQFTEERHLITLGWIHTHPTQSCFMSSVDLHTHSGFQRMLPESFAVVCAPSSTPQFGIFRLTDPGGLQTILDCNAKEAFHPHPDVPIYTDCDNSHVQMKDLALEIVDLR